mmetsp:Transcript_63271/g.137650  ORF Transcript_63271/g.137650 Transcript_63271/m.137650 type:complete len:557 (-) Transcript_63271:10-1680(-)
MAAVAFPGRRHSASSTQLMPPGCQLQLFSRTTPSRPQPEAMSSLHGESPTNGQQGQQDDALRSTETLPLVLPLVPSRGQPSASELTPAFRRVRSTAAALKTRLNLAVTSHLEGVVLAVSLTEGQLDEPMAHLGGPGVELTRGLPTVFSLQAVGAIAGSLCVNRAARVPFGIQVGEPRSCGERINYVSAEHRQRTVSAHAEHLEAGSGLSANGEGFVVEATVTSGPLAQMTVTIRAAKRRELGRLAQTEALVGAMQKRSYGGLLAQIVRSRSRKVETALIEEASRALRALQQPRGSFMTHVLLGRLMQWGRITSLEGVAADSQQPCPSEGCPCNAGSAQDGEICDIRPDAVSLALTSVAPAGVPPDKWLFKALVQAAITAPEGCVWKSGRKFILSNEERNQSPSAIVNLLERGAAENDASRGMRALVLHTEREYKSRVTAVQINFHPDQKSSHKQHRDIYGAGQKGGINCTCSFMKCTGTVCYSLGSSREILCVTMTDSRSKYEACGETCQGCRCLRWMHSGSSMYFNDLWNSSHSHGVPPARESCGPRISVALLCA